LECNLKKEVAAWVSVFILAFSVALCLVVPVNSPGSLVVTPEADRVTIENPLVQIVISTEGVRPIKWTTAEGLELAADAKPSGAIGNRTPLWDWIPSQMPWPGELCLGDYSYEIVGSNATVATIRFNYTCSQSPIEGLEVVKVLTFYADKYYFDMKITLINPTTGDISTAAPWDPTVGYNINAVEYAEPLDYLYQAYQDGEVPQMHLRLGWDRILASNLRWVAVYSSATGEIVAIAVHNVTNTVWLEGAGGSWGSETRVEFPSLTIAPQSQVTYVLQVYGGPLDFEQLSEVGMVNLAKGMGQIILHPVIWAEKTYYVATFSNSSVSDFSFSMPDWKISFNVTGSDATIGYCNVTIPKTLIRANATHPWTVLVDGTPVSPTVLEDGAYTFLYFTYAHSTQRVEIIGSMGPLPPKVIRVPEDYSTIQAAVNAANLGDVINVSSRTYYEHVIVDKSYLTLVGEDRSTTIIDGNGTGIVILITLGIWGIPSDHVSISGFTVQNSSSFYRDSGIRLNYASGTTISGNTASNNNGNGIQLWHSSNNTLMGNNVTNNEWLGICLDYSSNNNIYGNNITANNWVGIGLFCYSSYNTISGNNITNNADDGIRLYQSSYNAISGNTASNNGVHGISLGDSSDNNVVSNNVVTGNGWDGIVLWKDVLSPDHNVVSGNIVTSNYYAGIHLVHSGNSNIENNIATLNQFGIILHDSSNDNILHDNQVTLNSGAGITLVNSSNNAITCNNVSKSSWQGIALLNSSDNNIVSNNVVIENEREGIDLRDSSNNNCISGNNITNNGVAGISLRNSSNNKFYHNNIINNTPQVYDWSWDDPSVAPSINIWDDGYPSGGNYWSDYTDVDQYSGPYQNETGNDGIWDHPYVIDENNQDNYPKVPEFPSAMILPLLLIVALAAVILAKKNAIPLSHKEGKS